MPAIIATSALFPLGQIVITPNALASITQTNILEALQRHATGDWGTLSADDAEQNNLALRYGSRVFSAYGEGTRRFWIITEADRSATTILMPLDY